MGALPKKKISRRRRDHRRGHMHITPATLVACPSCRRQIASYQACPYCGQYRGRQVFQVKEAAAKS